MEQVRRAVQLHRVSDPAWRPADIAVFGGLAYDPAGAAGLAGTPTRRLDRCPLIRSARLLAPLLAERAHASVGRPAVVGESTSADHDDLAWPARRTLPSRGTVEASSTVMATDGALR